MRKSITQESPSRVEGGWALPILTTAPAYAAFQESDRGTIEPGKLADFTVLSADIMQVPESEILKQPAQ